MIIIVKTPGSQMGSPAAVGRRCEMQTAERSQQDLGSSPRFVNESVEFFNLRVFIKE